MQTSQYVLYDLGGDMDLTNNSAAQEERHSEPEDGTTDLSFVREELKRALDFIAKKMNVITIALEI